VAYLTKHPIADAFAVSLGGFVFGYDLGALSSATQSLRTQFHLSPADFGITISFSLWGTVGGSVLAGRSADRMGRRNLIAGCAMLYALGAVGTICPVPSEWAFILAMRFLCGMAIGGITVGCPLYLSELAPIGLRGRLVSLFQLQVGAGVVVAFAAGSLFAYLIAQGAVWRWCLGAGAIPAMVLLYLVGSLSESGPGLAGLTGAKKGSSIPVSSVIHETSDQQRLFCRRNMRLLLLATSIALFNQLSGVNIVLLYMLDILSSAAIGLDTGHRYSILVSCLSLLATVLGMACVDKAGRKPLLYIGSAGMAICLLCLAVLIPYHLGPVLYLSILVAYNAFFAFSQGTVVWVYLSELFPPGIRGAGQGYGSFVHWIANATLVLVFPMMQHASSSGIFYLFALMMALQMGVIWRWYPETRGIALGSLAAAGAHNRRDSTRIS
jgi:MFS family permease